MPKRPPLNVTQILAWCDAFHARTGNWPRSSIRDRGGALATSGPTAEAGVGNRPRAGQP
jgi:hypothetical protein